MLHKTLALSRLLSSATKKIKFSKGELTQKGTVNQTFYVVCAAKYVQPLHFNQSYPPRKQGHGTALTRGWHSVMQKQWCHFGTVKCPTWPPAVSPEERGSLFSPVLSPPAHAEMWDIQCISQPLKLSPESTCLVCLTLFYFQAFSFNINIQGLLSLCKVHQTAHNRPRPM